jgi:hypothetical protein
MEQVEGVFYGGRGQVGQQIVVTNRRLLIGPIDSQLALTIDAYVLDRASAGVGSFVKDVLNAYAPMNPTTLWLRHVRDVQPLPRGILGGLFKPPGVRITTDTDQTFDLRIVATTKTINTSPKNTEACNRALAVIHAAVQAAKAAPPPASGV